MRRALPLIAALAAAACVPVVGEPEGPEQPTLDGLPAPAECSDETPVLCEGAEAPDWELVDHQPKSARKGAKYGLAAFRGKVTVVALLAGW